MFPSACIGKRTSRWKSARPARTTTARSAARGSRTTSPTGWATTASCAAPNARSAGTIREGDLLFIKGRVKRKFVEDGRHLVEIEQEAHNQDKEQSVVGSGIVELPSRALTMGALDGVRVVDLSRVLAGPLCTQMLADHGADVIKVEPPTGDETRLFGPPFDDAGRRRVLLRGEPRQARSVARPRRRPRDAPCSRRLLDGADVLVENFLPGTMEKWGLGYEQLAQRHPRLVYCADFRLRRRRPARRAARLRRGAAGDVRAHERQRVGGVGTDAPRHPDRRSPHRLRGDERHPDGALRARTHAASASASKPRCSIPA